MLNPNKYNCDNCGFLYRAVDFKGADLDEQPQDFSCPTCQAGKDHFHLVVPPDDDVAGAEEAEEPKVELDPFGKRLMYTEESDEAVELYISRYDKGKLDLQPDFQRYEVWTTVKSSKLIESIIFSLPIPVIYVSQESDEKDVVIDGQQRLSAVIGYVKGKYALKGVNKKIEGLRFADLPSKIRSRIEAYKFPQVQILQESDPEVKFMLFQRLNEGSTSLNDQELRNCVHRGSYNDFLKKVAQEAEWRKLLRLKGTDPHPRMVDVELALRYFAFRDQTYMKHPDKNTAAFLDHQMVLGEKYSKKELEKSLKDFRAAIDVARTVFGENACRRYVLDATEGKQGKWDGRLNRALMDVQLWGFNRGPKGQFVKKADTLREAAMDLMSDPTFVDLITHTISEFKRVEKRFDMWKSMIEDVVGTTETAARFFPLALKKKLFTPGMTCPICEQSILTMDDAHVDHVLPFVKGGETVESNAQITHRYCNKAKGSEPPTQSQVSL